MSYNSGVVVLVNSNHSPDNSLNCIPLCPITSTTNYNNNNNDNSNRHNDEKANCHKLSIGLRVITYTSCYMMLWLQKWWYYEPQQEWLRWYDRNQMTLKWREKKTMSSFGYKKTRSTCEKTSPKKGCRFHNRSQAWVDSNVSALVIPLTLTSTPASNSVRSTFSRTPLFLEILSFVTVPHLGR